MAHQQPEESIGHAPSVEGGSAADDAGEAVISRSKAAASEELSKASRTFRPHSAQRSDTSASPRGIKRRPRFPPPDSRSVAPRLGTYDETMDAMATSPAATLHGLAAIIVGAAGAGPCPDIQELCFVA
eukprot:16440164-Heterocapsa_arctica.AAC.1